MIGLDWIIARTSLKAPLTGTRGMGPWRNERVVVWSDESCLLDIILLAGFPSRIDVSGMHCGKKVCLDISYPERPWVLAFM